MTTRFPRRTALGTTLAAGLAPGTAHAEETEIVRWRHYVNCRYGQLHIFSARPKNEDAIKHPPLAFCHPSPTSGDFYHDIQGLMATDRVVHCLDTPGFGFSDGPASKPNMDDYGGATADALADLGFGAERRIDIFGFHTGALVAAAAVLDRPSLFRRLVLSGVPHYTDEERARQYAQNVRGYPFFEDPDYVGTMYRRLVLDAKDSGPIERRLSRFADRLRAGPQGIWGIDAVFTYDTGKALPKLDLPVLLIAFNEMMT
ncbi:MAG: alpha/beta fold hydrolase, partial [Rhodobacteraceae bacterium]|nr:alpha/beta fold hydrolase [Paracoccaceae bacterium]